MAAEKHTKPGELREIVQALEELQAKAAVNKFKFLAYLLEMSRMEAVSLLSKQGQKT